MDGSTRVSGHSEALRNYKLGRTLGIGNFGKVKIAEHKLTGHKVAIKIINCHQMKETEIEKAKREIKILKLFSHPHIIQLYEVIYTPTDIYVVMEYCKYGELYYYIVEKGRLEEAEARLIFQQIIAGVEYCHRNMVVHRDLKPENLLLDSKYNVKLADFGFSNVIHDGHFLKTSCGSPNYAAPEIISGKQYAGPEVDVWSCGVILYALVCGNLPFDDGNILKLFKKIKGGMYTLPSHLSALARDLIPRMLIVDPMKRITIHEIREHQWFQICLPPYLAVPPPDTSQRAKMATVAYYVLLDNRFCATNGYLGADYQESTEKNLNQVASTESASSTTRHYLPGSSHVHGNGLRPHYPVERKWTLGLQSCAHPREIMVEVLKALKELNVCWKNNGLYNMKCRWCFGAPEVHDMLDVNNNFLGDSTIMDNDDSNERLPAVIKFEMQLYKTREDKYLIDLQRVTGPQLLFLDLCAAFLTKLRVL